MFKNIFSNSPLSPVFFPRGIIRVVSLSVSLSTSSCRRRLQAVRVNSRKGRNFFPSHILPHIMYIHSYNIYKYLYIYTHTVMCTIYVYEYMGPDVTRTRRAGHHYTRAAQYFSADISSLSAHIYLIHLYMYICVRIYSVRTKRDT